MPVEKIKAILPWLKRPTVWLPSLLVPLIAGTLWAYLDHPEWLEATVEENASTGEIVELDPNSPVTEADLSLDDLTAVAQASDLSSLLNQVNLNQSADAGKEGQQDPNAEGATEQTETQSQEKADSSSNKPRQTVTNPFADAVQGFLHGGSSNSSAKSQGPLGFSPILPTFNLQNGTGSGNALQQALLELNTNNSPTTETNSSTPEVLGEPAQAAIDSALLEQQPYTSESRGRSSVSGQTPDLLGQNSNLSGPTPYVPGQVPYVLPGQSSQQGRSGFIAPSPGQSQYYPNQRGTGGYQVTPGGTTFSRQRGSTGDVVTPQGILAPRQRGGTGSLITPQGTTYNRQRGSTGFTVPQVNSTTTNPGVNATPGNPVFPNNVQSTPLGTQN